MFKEWATLEQTGDVPVMVPGVGGAEQGAHGVMPVLPWTQFEVGPTKAKLFSVPLFAFPEISNKVVKPLLTPLSVPWLN